MKKINIILKNNENRSIEILRDTNMKIIYIGKKEDKMLSKITFTHSLPNIKSRIEVKAVVFDNSRFDFEGLLKIKKGAVNTDTYLKIDCLVVSDSASARAILSLEILESEVKAGHGATIGYLDALSLYYLKSRGIKSDLAEEFLINAFLKSK